MNEMTVEEFCGRHVACYDGRDWAVKNCTSMDDAWQKLKPEWLIWVATRKGVLTDRELRLFAVWSARQVQHLMKDPRSLRALDVAEGYAEGLVTDEELKAAWDDARAAWAAAGAAAGDAAWNAARDAASAAARDAAWDAARDAARYAAEAAAWDAARAAQAEWLRKKTKPNFGRTK